MARTTALFALVVISVLYGPDQADWPLSAAQESEIEGAAAMLEGDRSLQKSALAVHPSPRIAEK